MMASIFLALASSPLTSADRAVRSDDRSKNAVARSPSSEIDWRATIDDMVYRLNKESRTTEGNATNSVAELLSSVACQNDKEILTTLMQILSADLEPTAANEKLLSDLYRRLGDLYEGTATKQVHWYSLAMQYAPDPGTRAQLEEKISDLGGDAFAFAVTPRPTTAGTRTCDWADTCETAVAVALDYSDVLTIEGECVDHDWFSFDVTGPDGLEMTIATMSEDIYGDDTDLELWDGCSGNLLQADDDSGPGFLSLIETGCLAPGTYYVAVGGWLDMSYPDDFDFTITAGDPCLLPGPDGYEPDNDCASASHMGSIISVPLHASGWGRMMRGIRDHSIYPAGDIDFTHFETRRNEMVRMATAEQFPTIWNDNTSSAPEDNPDTILELFYGADPDYGGLCNNPQGDFPDPCYSDADCEGLTSPDPVPSYPPCIPLQYFDVGGGSCGSWSQALAYNDDRGGADFGSELFICLPRSDRKTTSLTAEDGWCVGVQAYSENDIFEYQLKILAETTCNFEIEPNNRFQDATPLIPGESMHGFYDKSAFPGWVADADLYSFDVEEMTVVRFRTDGYDPCEVDTALEIYVGPDDFGYYHPTGITSDDCIGRMACLDVVLPPANDLMGNVVVDPDYIINVTSWYLNMNFPYKLEWYVLAFMEEEEPNDTCETSNSIEPGSLVYGVFFPECDYDAFNLTLTEDTYVVFETNGSDDSVMALETTTGDWLACDDDSGPNRGSKIEGCLPPGEYCLRLRPFGYYMSFNYELTYTATPGCVPTDPPSMIYDGYGRCDGDGYASPEEEFNTCPN
jgi:hypothetical protein